MNEYKRLTNKDWKENYDIFEDVCCDTCAEDCGECERNFNALVRLAELEDKIQNGTLIELPCKVGDMVYEIEYNCWEVCHDCSHFSTFFGMDENCDMGYETYPDAKKLNANCEKHELQIEESIFSIEFYARHFNDFGKIVFTTKAEAEKKLLELRDKKEAQDERMG